MTAFGCFVVQAVHVHHWTSLQLRDSDSAIADGTQTVHSETVVHAGFLAGLVRLDQLFPVAPLVHPVRWEMVVPACGNLHERDGAVPQQGFVC
jgi:hypothetical protein